MFTMYQIHWFDILKNVEQETKILESGLEIVFLKNRL